MSEFFQKIKAFFLAMVAFFAGLFGVEGQTNQIVDPAIETGISNEQYFAEYFTPVLRFAVASDVHIDDANSENEEERLPKLFQTAYAYADTQEDYSGLDGIFFVGDVSNTGTVSSLQKFFNLVNENKREETTVRAVLGNHEFYKGGADTVNRFLSISGYEQEDVDLVIGGYHFILLCPDKSGNGYSENKQKWLNAGLKAAAKEDETGTKPIFVFQHHNVKNTVYGSEAWGVSDLKSVLEKYPQVVDFSGHSHYPISDPRSIWQGSFTALSDGTLSFYEMGLAGVTESGVFATNDKGGYTDARCYRDAAQYYIVEVDKNQSIRILGYDLLSDTFICEYDLRIVGNPELFTYTNARKEASVAPVFTKSAVITKKLINEDSALLAVPQATGDKNNPVQHYRFDVYNNKDEKVYTGYSLACTYYFPTPQVIEHTVTGLLPDKEYKVLCTAVSSWGKESEPIMTKFKTMPSEHENIACYQSAVKPDVFCLTVFEDGCVYNGVTAEKLTKIGTPMPYDFALYRYGLVLDGASGIIDKSFRQNYDKLTKSISVEFYGSVDVLNPNSDSYTDILGNMQKGGVGIECTDKGEVQFYISINNTYHSPDCKVEEGEVFHFVGTYDGNTIRVYKNGELVASEQAEGELTFTKLDAAKYLGVGGDSNVSGKLESCYTGKMNAANIYSQVLSAEQVSALYLGFCEK